MKNECTDSLLLMLPSLLSLPFFSVPKAPKPSRPNFSRTYALVIAPVPLGCRSCTQLFVILSARSQTIVVLLIYLHAHRHPRRIFCAHIKIPANLVECAETFAIGPGSGYRSYTPSSLPPPPTPAAPKRRYVCALSGRAQTLATATLPHEIEDRHANPRDLINVLSQPTQLTQSNVHRPS